MCDHVDRCLLCVTRVPVGTRVVTRVIWELTRTAWNCAHSVHEPGSACVSLCEPGPRRPSLGRGGGMWTQPLLNGQFSQKCK